MSALSELVAKAILEQTIASVIADTVAVILADLETGEIIHATPWAEELFGYTVRGELVGRSVDLLVPDASRGAHEGHRKNYAADPHPRPMGLGAPLRGRRKDGAEFPVVIGLTPTMAGGRAVVVTMVVSMEPRWPWR